MASDKVKMAVTLTPAEKAAIEKKAAGVPFSAYVRKLLGLPTLKPGAKAKGK